MSHLLNSTNRRWARLPPVWKQWRGLLFVLIGRWLALVARVGRSHRVRASVAYLLIAVGLVSQLVLLLVAGYLIDLSLSLMNVWTDLARKHLEITL